MIPIIPIGNQQQKSDMATRNNCLAAAKLWAFLNPLLHNVAYRQHTKKSVLLLDFMDVLNIEWFPLGLKWFHFNLTYLAIVYFAYAFRELSFQAVVPFFSTSRIWYILSSDTRLIKCKYMMDLNIIIWHMVSII